jgi:preprotein translocase subunit SecD
MPNQLWWVALASVIPLVVVSVGDTDARAQSGAATTPTRSAEAGGAQFPQLELRLADTKPASGLQQARTSTGETIHISHSAIISSRDIVGARAIEQDGRLGIDLDFASDAANRVAAATKGHIGKRIAIIIDKRIMSAPVLESPVSDSVRITGTFTKQEVEDLTAALRRLAEKNRSERGFLCRWLGRC